MPPKETASRSGLHGATTRNRSREGSPAPKHRQADADLITMLNAAEEIPTDALGPDPQQSIIKLLLYIAKSQSELSTTLTTNHEDIEQLKVENKKLKSEVKCLTEDMVRVDQYSRKGVMTVTGLSYDDTETQESLESTVVGMFNALSPSPGRTSFNKYDFVAIHRNGKNSKPGRNGGLRPPTATVKFLRYTDKDMFFSKTANARRKQTYPGVGFHHNLCPRLIEEQKIISGHNDVKFVQFMGATRWFSVCLNCDKFLNYIRSYEHFITELEKFLEEGPQ